MLELRQQEIELANQRLTEETEEVYQKSPIESVKEPYRIREVKEPCASTWMRARCSWLSSMSACAFRARATSPDIWPGWLRPLQGRLFSTREHFFVAAKFMWNGASPESPGVQAVLQAATGFEALRLGKAGGRELRNFDTVGWDAEGRLRAMEVAALQQVITNGQFRARLLGTGDAWLAEAKSENFWGIGATLDKVQLMETGEWRALRGQNWHGRILMAARGLTRRGSDALPRQETA